MFDQRVTVPISPDKEKVFRQKTCSTADFDERQLTGVFMERPQ
jgi:hypothetical protein